MNFEQSEIQYYRPGDEIIFTDYQKKQNKRGNTGGGKEE